MDNKTTPPNRFSFVVDRSNEIELIPRLYELEDVLRSGDQSFADGWHLMLGDLETQIRDGWLNREHAVIERFDLCIDMTKGDSDWNVRVTMQPVLQ